MDKLCVALVQKCTYNHLEQSLKACQSIAGQAKKGGAHVVLFPRLWLNGEGHPLEKSAQKASSPQIQLLCQTASQLGIAIAVTGAFVQENTTLDKTLLIDENGQVALEYNSVHPQNAQDFGRGQRFGVAQVHGFTIGLMSDHDADFPESARVLRLLGAQVALVCANREMSPFFLHQLAVRACENQIGIAMANTPGQSKGVSCAFLPWNAALCAPNEAQNVLTLAGREEEGLYYSTFCRQQILQVRQSQDILSQRVPSAYQPIVLPSQL